MPLFDESLLIYRTSTEHFEGFLGGKIKELMLDLQPKQKACVEMAAFSLIFEEEIRYVIKGRDIKSFEVYKAVGRDGRRKQLGVRQREVVWKVYSTYQNLLSKAKREDWSDIAYLTLQTLLRTPLNDAYNDVIVDEAQDLTLVERYVIQHLVDPLRDKADSSGSLMILADGC